MAKFSVACPECGKAYRVDDSLVGRSARCKKCSSSFVVTKMADTDVGALIAALGDELVSKRHADDRVSHRAIRALGRIGEPAVTPLTEALGRTLHAHAALALIGGEHALRVLCHELGADDPRRARAAAKALGQMADGRAVSYLKHHKRARDRDVREAVVDALANIDATHREMTHGRWFQVDREHPHDQVLRIRWQIDPIAHDPELRQRALRWHHDFCAAMPTMAFADDHERAETWHRLGTLVFTLLYPDKILKLVDGHPAIHCPEAAFCFDQSHRYQS